MDLHEVFGIKSDKRRLFVKYSAVRHDYRDSYPKLVAINELDQIWAFHMQLRTSMVDVRCQPNGCRHITHKPTRVQDRSNTLVKHNGGEEFDVYACPHDSI